MQPWRVHKLYEMPDNEDEDSTLIGGAIVGITTYPANGHVSEISIVPLDEETMDVGIDSTGKSVRLQIAGTVAVLDVEETEKVIELMKIALEAAKKNQIS